MLKYMARPNRETSVAAMSMTVLHLVIDFPVLLNVPAGVTFNIKKSFWDNDELPKKLTSLS